MCHVSYVICHVSRVTRHLTPVTWHLSPVTNANSQNHRLSPPCYSPPPCTAGWFAKTKQKNMKINILKKKSSKQLAYISNELFDPKFPVHREAGFSGGDERTSHIIDWNGLRANSVREKKLQISILHGVSNDMKKMENIPLNSMVKYRKKGYILFFFK